jgi:hypothetical protein
VGSAVSPVLRGLVAAHSIRGVFLSGAGNLALVVLRVGRLMAERGPALEAAPSVDES